MGHKKITISATLTHDQWAMISSCCFQEADSVRDNPSMLKEDRDHERKFIKTLFNFSDIIDRELKIGRYHPSFLEVQNDSSHNS